MTDGTIAQTLEGRNCGDSGINTGFGSGSLRLWLLSQSTAAAC